MKVGPANSLAIFLAAVLVLSACAHKQDANNHTVSASKQSPPADPNQIAVMKQSCAYMSPYWCVMSIVFSADGKLLASSLRRRQLLPLSERSHPPAQAIQ